MASVVGVASRKPFDFHSATPRLGEGLDSVGGEHEIDVEGAVSELDEVLAPADLVRLRLGQLEAQLAGARLVIVIVGLGGGFGSGAAPIVAAAAKARGALVVTLAVRPFAFDGR